MAADHLADRPLLIDRSLQPFISCGWVDQEGIDDSSVAVLCPVAQKE